METDWRKELTSMKKRNMHIFKTGLRSDCWFLVGIVPEDKRLFPAHKFVLANASPVFERMFFGSLPEKENQPIEIYDIDAEDFYSLLHYIYTEDIPALTVDRAQQLYYASSKYMLDQLMKECVTYLKTKITIDNVCQVMEFAKQFEEINLEEACMQIIKIRTNEVLLSPSLVLANISTLETILDQDKLKISSELEIFNALQRYADFRFSINKRPDAICKTCEKRLTPLEEEESFTIIKETEKVVREVCEGAAAKTSPPKVVENPIKPKECKLYRTSRENTEDIAKFLNIVKKVRFLTMSVTTFAGGPALSKLLSEGDALAILVCLQVPANIKDHFPQGFSDLNRNRFSITDTRANRTLGSYAALRSVLQNESQNDDNDE